MRKLLAVAMAWIGTHYVAVTSYAGAGDQGAKVKKNERSGIVVRVGVQQRIVEKRLRVLVSFEFKNTSAKTERLESWLALQPAGVPPAVLRVFNKNGDGIGYIGPFINRLEAKPSDFLVFRPGQSRAIPDVDVTDYYNWPGEAQRLRLKYEAYSSGGADLELVESDPVEFDYQPVIARPGIPRERLIKKSRSSTESK